MNKNRKIKWLIIGICAVALVGWGVLMVVIFGGGGKDGGRKTPETGIPEVPQGSVLVWCRTEAVEIYDGVTRGTRYKYDDEGRCIRSAKYEDYSKLKAESDVRTFEYISGEGLVRETYDKDVYLDIWADDPETFEGRTEILLDVDGNQRGKKEYIKKEDGSYLLVYESESNRYGIKTSIFSYDKNGVLKEGARCGVDANGWMVSGEEYVAATGQWRPFERAEFDELGRAVKVYRIWPEGGEVVEETITHREDGAWTVWSHNMYDDSVVEYRIDFDKDGERILNQQLQDGKPWGYYDSLETEPTERGTLERYTEYNYDDNGNPYPMKIVTRELDHKGNTLQVYQYNSRIDSEGVIYEAEYDEQGRIMKSVVRYESWDWETDSKEILSTERAYTYDEYGNCISIMVTEENGETWREQFTYVPKVITEEQAKENEQYYDPTAIEDYGEKEWSFYKKR